MGLQEAPPGVEGMPGKLVWHVGSSYARLCDLEAQEQVAVTQVTGWRGEEGQI